MLYSGSELEVIKPMPGICDQSNEMQNFVPSEIIVNGKTECTQPPEQFAPTA